MSTASFKVNPNQVSDLTPLAKILHQDDAAGEPEVE